MALLLKPSVDPAEEWIRLFREHMPEMEVRVFPEAGAPEDIEFALMRAPPEGLLATMPNLRLLASIPAGVERLLKPGIVPDNVPIIRCVSNKRAHEMAEYCLMQALRFHRAMPAYDATIAEGRWERILTPETDERRAGVMGMGELGLAVAERLRDAGFETAGWTRTKKEVDGIESFHGADGLDPFLARTDILVSLLPLTPETDGILDASLFAKLPQGAFVINVGRGQHLVEEDLLAALDSGHLGGAGLDVLNTEPPPADHPLLRHPKTLVTPHISCRSRARHLIYGLVDNMQRARDGRPLLNQVDRSAGY